MILKNEGQMGKTLSALIWSTKPVQCWWHSLQGAVKWTRNLRDMGRHLIRCWWGEQRLTASDWSRIWNFACTDVQSWSFPSGLSCRVNVSLSLHPHVGVCTRTCRSVSCCAGGRYKEYKCIKHTSEFLI